MPPATTYVSLAELNFGRCMRTVYDLIHPENKLHKRVLNKQENPKIPRVTNFDIDDLIMIRNYVGNDTWIPGVATERTGPVSYRCETEISFELWSYGN